VLHHCHMLLDIRWYNQETSAWLVPGYCLCSVLYRIEPSRVQLTSWGHG
jgi:hypothetical protein